MRARWLHTLLVLTTFAVVWLVASPARARARASEEASMSMMTTMSVAPKALATSATLATPPSSPSPSPITSKAPLCDPRGATSFAAAPQMQDLEVTLDTSATAEDCLASSRHHESYRPAPPGRAPLPANTLSTSSDAAILTVVATLAASAREACPAPVASTSCSRPGFRSTVDRPPRA